MDSSGGWIEMALPEMGQRRGGRNIPNEVRVTVFEVPLRYPGGDALVMCLKYASGI